MNSFRKAVIKTEIWSLQIENGSVCVCVCALVQPCVCCVSSSCPGPHLAEWPPSDVYFAKELKLSGEYRWKRRGGQGNF